MNKMIIINAAFDITIILLISTNYFVNKEFDKKNKSLTVR